MHNGFLHIIKFLYVPISLYINIYYNESIFIPSVTFLPRF